MSELYHHLLVPQDTAFVPEPDEVARFFNELETLGALPNERKFRVITGTGKMRTVENAHTDKVYTYPELRVRYYTELPPAIYAAYGEPFSDLSAEGMGPAAIPPFDLYRVNCPDDLWKGPYSFAVHCRQHEKITHFLHSPVDCGCVLHPDEPGIFENPWNNKPVQTPARSCARFWIEFTIGDWLMPMITDSLEVLDPRLLAAANDSFGIGFDQGCICNDD